MSTAATGRVEPQTLREAHDVLWGMRPAASAPLATWRTFRLYCARTYTKIADIDRAHHHESLYFAQYERRLADELKQGIDKGENEAWTSSQPG